MLLSPMSAPWQCRTVLTYATTANLTLPLADALCNPNSFCAAAHTPCTPGQLCPRHCHRGSTPTPPSPELQPPPQPETCTLAQAPPSLMEPSPGAIHGAVLQSENEWVEAELALPSSPVREQPPKGEKGKKREKGVEGAALALQSGVAAPQLSLLPPLVLLRPLLLMMLAPSMPPQPQPYAGGEPYAFQRWSGAEAAEGVQWAGHACSSWKHTTAATAAA